VYRAAVLLRSFVKPLEIPTSFTVCQEASLAIVATLNEMLRNSRQIDPWLACHFPSPQQNLNLPTADEFSETGNGCFGPAE
jgi:hypothetical protein